MEKIKAIYTRQSISDTNEIIFKDYECIVSIDRYDDETTDLFFSIYDPITNEYKEELLTINGKIDSLLSLVEWLNNDSKFKVMEE